MKYESTKGAEVPALPESLQDMQKRLAELQQRCAAQLTKDPSLFSSLEKEIHLTFRQLADRFSAALLAHAASSKALDEPSKKK
jgi:hypothetical protein